MKHIALIGLLLSLGLNAKADIKQDAQSAATLAGQVNAIIQGDAKAASDLKASSLQLHKSASSLQTAIHSQGVHQKSKDELWKVIRLQRNMEALLSVSPLRKNQDLNEKIKQLQAKLNLVTHGLE